MATRKDECSFIIIATRNNKIESQFLVVADTIYNHPPSLPDTHPIYWQFARTDKVKELIVSQTCIGASSKQVIATIQLDTDKKNLLVKLKEIYNKRATQSQKYHGLLTLV